MPTELRFTTVAAGRPRGGITIRLPADADDVWGQKTRHDLVGSVGGHRMRGTLVRDATGYRLDLGPAWCRDPNVGAGRTVEVALVPEDPQVDTVASDIREAFLASPPARHAFESLATFYRKGFIRWIESAKRPDTRRTRIEGMVATLLAGGREP